MRTRIASPENAPQPFVRCLTPSCDNYLESYRNRGKSIQSLLSTCRPHDVDPYRYLVDVLQRISIHPAKDVIDLTPRVWKTKFADSAFVSHIQIVGQ